KSKSYLATSACVCLYDLCFSKSRIVGFRKIKNKTEVNVLETENAKATRRVPVLLNDCAKDESKPKNGKIMITTTMLNMDAASATNLDIGVNLRLTSKAVEVVPIFAPTTIGIAISISIVP